MGSRLRELDATLVGEGPLAALYLPGVGHHGDDGRQIAEAIGNSHTTHLLDLPGTGRSPARPGVGNLQDFARVLDRYADEAGVNEVDVIGHSLGGILGLGYAHACPTRVRSLTLLDSGYFRVPRFPTTICGPLGFVMPALDVLHRALGDRTARLLGSAPANPYSAGRAIAYEDDAAEVYPQALGMLLAAYRADPPAMLRRTRVPCLLMYGGRQNSPRERRKVLAMVRPYRGGDGMRLVELIGGHRAHREDLNAAQHVAAGSRGHRNTYQII